MKARDIMTSAVKSVGGDAPTHETAKILRDQGISEVPVVDEAGAPIGMLAGALARRGGRAPSALGARPQAAWVFLSAWMLDFPGKKPGDIGMFLVCKQ